MAICMKDLIKLLSVIRGVAYNEWPSPFVTSLWENSQKDIPPAFHWGIR